MWTIAEVISSSRDGIDGTLQILGSWENGVMVNNDSFDKLIDMGLAGDLVVAFWDRHESGAETDGQIVGVHHVLLTVLGQVVEEGKEVSHDNESFA